MKIEYTPHYNFEIKDCKTSSINAVFASLLPLVLAELYHLILVSFANMYMSSEQKPFACPDCGEREDFIWKTRNGKETTITTIWTKIKFPQLQIQCKSCSRKIFITRKLLEMAPRTSIAHSVAKKLALIGALTTYRSSKEIISMFGSSISRSTIWRSVQSIGSQITFSLDTEGISEGMAGGTGIPIQGIKKRGRELKVFAQKTLDGGLRIAGLAIGKYESGWDAVFEPLREQFEKMGQFHLTIDGDKAILRGLKANIKLTVQRCLWHIPHQIKHNLWRDDIARKSSIWLKIMSESVMLVSLPDEIPEEQELRDEIIKNKIKQVDKLLKLMEKHKCKHSATFLRNAKDNMYTSLKLGLEGKTSSLIERLMRTVNLRINVGKWGEKGALNLLRIRLAYYYNDFKAS